MTAWLTWLRDRAKGAGKAASSEPLILVTVLASEGSAPCGPGARMMLSGQTCLGSIGGASLEGQIAKDACTLALNRPGSWHIEDYVLGPMAGQSCGGRIRLLIEHIDPAALDWMADAEEGRTLVTTLSYSGVKRHISVNATPLPLSARGDHPREGSDIVEIIGQRRRSIYLFGAGDIGQAIARHARLLPLRLAWFDTRPVFAMIDGVAIAPEAMIEHCITEAPDGSAIIALTHDPTLDYRLIKAALLHNDIAFVGLMGTDAKRERFISRLERDKVPLALRDRLICPIGISNLSDKEPDVIAIAVLAKILQLETP